MKPFNLEKALAGEPVVTRDGRPVKIAGYNPEGDESFQVLGWIKDAVSSWCVHSWRVNGSFWSSQEKNSLDLFMAEKPKVKKGGWVLLSEDHRFRSVYSKIYESKETADIAFQGTGNVVAKIEWEEEL